MAMLPNTDAPRVRWLIPPLQIIIIASPILENNADCHPEMSFFQAENRCCSCDEVHMHLLHRSHLLVGTVFFQNCKRCCECERCIWWYRCPACFKQFSSKQILIQHLEKVGHSRHDPQCGSCHKHCFCFESLREHLLGNSFVLFLKTLCWRLKSWSRGCLGYWMYVMTTSTPYVIIWY